MQTNTFTIEQQALAAAWKMRTTTLPDKAREPAPWINHQGKPRGRYAYCLPPEYADLNLLPDVRVGALDLFDELGIPWHCGVAGGPGNHLLSSQVQCVNALFPMTHAPAKIVAAFGHVVDIGEVLEVEPGRFLTFEYIGPIDYFGEGRGAPRVRGTHCTSVDAAFLYRTSAGATELALVEWKYTESYPQRREPRPAYDKVREQRYGDDLRAEDGPVRADVLDFELLLDEPFYQLMRQQLLAHRLEQDRAEGADVVRVLHVLDPANAAYQASLMRPEHHDFGDTVDDVWSRLLRAGDRFLHVDPAIFLRPATTSQEYVSRYRAPDSGLPA